MGLPTPPLYRPRVIGVQVRYAQVIYKEEGQLRSLDIRASSWNLSSRSTEDPFYAQPSPCTPSSHSRVTEQGSHPDTGTPLGREVHRSTSVNRQPGSMTNRVDNRCT